MKSKSRENYAKDGLAEYFFDCLVFWYGSWERASASRFGQEAIEHYLEPLDDWRLRKEEIIAKGPSPWATVRVPAKPVWGSCWEQTA